MRSVPAATLAVLQNAPENGIKTRDFFWIENVGGTQGWGFYSGIDPILSVQVISGITGAPEDRVYYGAGALQSISDIPLTIGLNVHSISVRLSNIHPTVQNVIRGENIRNGRVEIHRGVIDPLTDNLADPPLLHFVGTLNKASPKRPSIGGSGGITVECTSITNELTRSNPAMFSDSTIRRRDGDRFCRYMEVMADVKVNWGGESSPDRRRDISAPSQR